jgi:hypothetical protein
MGLNFRPRRSIGLGKGVRLNRGGSMSVRVGNTTLNSKGRVSVRTPVGSLVITPKKAAPQTRAVPRTQAPSPAVDARGRCLRPGDRVRYVGPNIDVPPAMGTVQSAADAKHVVVTVDHIGTVAGLAAVWRKTGRKERTGAASGQCALCGYLDDRHWLACPYNPANAHIPWEPTSPELPPRQPRRRDL